MRAGLAHADVFWDGPASGRPLAVLVNPPALSGAACRAWAGELGLPTAFVWSGASPDRYRCRLFTSGGEVPCSAAGTIAAAWVLRRLGRVRAEAMQDGEPPVPVRVAEGGAFAAAPERSAGHIVPAALAAEVLGIPSLWIARDRPPEVVSFGTHHLVVPLEADYVGAVNPPPSRMKAATDRTGAAAVTVWAFSGSDRIHARTFTDACPGGEDPGSGAGALAVGVYLLDAAGVTYPVTYVVRQGAELGRASTLWLRLDRGGRPPLEVGGRVRMRFLTDLEMDDDAP
jgi:PhzF family phenazine biosynthesis protein